MKAVTKLSKTNIIFVLLLLIIGAESKNMLKNSIASKAASKPTIVMVIEDRVTQIGFEGEDDPISFPTLVVRKKSSKEVLIGDEARLSESSKDSTVSFPVKGGEVENWEDFEKIVEYAFKKKGVQPSEHKVLISESPFNPKEKRDKLLKLFKEKFKVAKIHAFSSARLALFANGMMTGLVVEVGDNAIFVVPVIDGVVDSNKMQKVDLGGNNVVTYLGQLLRKDGVNISSTFTLRNILKSQCYLALDFYNEVYKDKMESRSTNVEVSDGNIVSTASLPLFKAPEAFFKPSFIEKDINGLHFYAFKTLHNVDLARRTELFRSILLTGEYAGINGFQKRLEKELKGMMAVEYPPKVFIDIANDTSKFRGAGLVTSLPSFKDETAFTNPINLDRDILSFAAAEGKAKKQEKGRL